MDDHRKLGRELGLFDTDPLIGAGLPFWLPAGAAVRHALEEYLRELERRAGYSHVYSPVLGKRELYEISGHWSHYRDGMYPPMELGPMESGREEVVLRPSLCPHHALLYRSRGRSYRELPLRLAELGGQYRTELSGVLGGLTRVRAMQLNDAHIFCTPDQAAGEARAALAMIRQAYAALGVEPARYRLSLPGPARQGINSKYVGDPRIWDQAAAMLAGKPWSPHKIQGWTPDFIPAVLNRAVPTSTVTVSDAEAFATARALAQKEGIFVGISAGATVAATLTLAKQSPAGTVLLAMLPDTGERYLSTALFEGL